MTRPLALMLALGLGLAGCGTPQERCIRTATTELRTVEALISEVRGDLARGYAIETYQRTESRWIQCLRPVPPRQPGQAVQYVQGMCFDDVIVTATRPRAIDPALERRKLDGLTQRQASLSRAAGRAIAACRAQFPEG